MKRFIFIILLLLLALLVLGMVVVPDRVGTLIESSGRDATGSTVSVQEVDIGYLRTRLAVESIEIAPSEGFDAPYAVRIKRLDAQLKRGSLLDEVIVVDSLVIEDLHLVVQQKGLGLSAQSLIRELRAYAEIPDNDDTLYRLGLLRISGIRVTFDTQLGDRSVDLPDVSLRDVGSDLGDPLPLLWKNVLEPVLVSAIPSAAR